MAASSSSPPSTPPKATSGRLGKNIAFSHWSVARRPVLGHRQFCTAISGEALTAFISKYPAKDSQEPPLSTGSISCGGYHRRYFIPTEERV
jgi:hypothetical protein